MARLDSLIPSRALNAVLSWLLVGVLVASVVGNLVRGDILWAGFAAVVVVVALVPPLWKMDYTMMVSWDVLLLSVLPAVTRLGDALTTPLGYFSIAALGVLVVAEIDQFTSARMPAWFAAALVIMATMSVASGWTILRFFANRWLGTSSVTTVNALMWDLIVASAVGVAFGVLFTLVFRGKVAV